MQWEALERRLLRSDTIDLQFSEFEVKPYDVYRDPAAGAREYLWTCKIRNVGTGTVKPSVKVKIVLSKDAIPGNGDDIAAEAFDLSGEYIPYRDISAGGHGIFVPPTTPAGRYYVAAVIDPNSQVAETNKRNNVVISTAANLTVATELISSDSVYGTAGKDVIVAQNNLDGDFFLSVNGAPPKAAKKGALPTKLFIDSGAGDDVIDAHFTHGVPLLITGSGGNDAILGGEENDSISGGNGRDRIFGGAGDDDLFGAAQGDYIDGQFGADTIRGGGGGDRLYAGNDESGDVVVGGAGNDIIVDISYGLAHSDTLSGGSGEDTATHKDTLTRPDVLEGLEHVVKVY
jgi:Ca2+-binding RTX toxin-like protein